MDKSFMTADISCLKC